MNIPVPEVTVICYPDRDYLMVIQQTKMVYDSLLMDKYSKLNADIMAHKGQWDAKCNHMARTDENKALEYGVKAQEALIRLAREHEAELIGLHVDYQEKLNKMLDTFEKKWKQDHHQLATIHPAQAPKT